MCIESESLARSSCLKRIEKKKKKKARWLHSSETASSSSQGGRSILQLFCGLRTFRLDNCAAIVAGRCTDTQTPPPPTRTRTHAPPLRQPPPRSLPRRARTPRHKHDPPQGWLRAFPLLLPPHHGCPSTPAPPRTAPLGSRVLKSRPASTSRASRDNAMSRVIFKIIPSDSAGQLKSEERKGEQRAESG